MCVCVCPGIAILMGTCFKRMVWFCGDFVCGDIFSDSFFFVVINVRLELSQG